MRTYLSVVLLLCLAVQFAPLSLIHSHDDHAHNEGHHHEMLSANADNVDVVIASDVEHESSDEECHICEIQQSLNNQAYTLNKQVGIFNHAQQVSEYVGIATSVDNFLIKRTSGRAPPRA